MNRLKMTLAVLLLACAQSAKASPVSLETAWNEKTVSITTNQVTAFTFDVGGFGAAGYALEGGTLTLNGVDGTSFGSTATIRQTISADTIIAKRASNVVGFEWSFLAQGSTAAIKISQTIKTPPPAGRVLTASGFTSPAPQSNYFTVPVISTSSIILAPSGVTISHSFRAMVSNPVFIVSGLTPASTYTLTVTYGVPQLQ